MDGSSSQRDSDLAQVVQLAIERYEQTGEIDELAIVNANPTLMPELGEQLAALRKVKQAKETSDETETAQETVTAQTPSSSQLPPQDSFEGYDIIREVQRGGQGVVYQALQKATKRKVAIKVMLDGPFSGGQAAARFEREVQILAQLKHPNIVTVHDSGSAGGSLYLVMDYISGQTLDDYLATKPLTVQQKLDLFVEICDALNAAHLRGVIHRDLKPSNIRVDSSDRPYVLDFGLAKLATANIAGGSGPIVTMTGQFLGSLPWSSPEQAEGSTDRIDVRTDVYALGVILYHMLTGQFPYNVAGKMNETLDNILRATPKRPRTLNNLIDDELETIILKCLHKAQERRYQSAGELARDLRHYMAGESIEAKRDSSLYVLKKTVQRNKGLFTFGSVALVTIGVGLVVGVNIWRDNAARNLQMQISTLQAEGMASYEQDKYTEAKRSFQAALALDPHNLRTLNLIGWNYVLQERDRFGDDELLEQMAQVGREILELDPHNDRGIFYLAHVYKRRQMYDDMAGLYEDCIAHATEGDSVAACQSNLGAVYVTQGKMRQALELLQESVAALGPAESWHSDLWRNLAALQLHFKAPQATDSVTQALACDKSDAKARLVAARIALRSGDRTQATDNAKFAYELADHEQTRARAQRMLALAYLAGDEYVQTHKAANAALGHGDLSTINRLILAIAYTQESLTLAESELQNAKREWPADLGQPGDISVVTENALIWIESADQLLDLQDRAQKLLAEKTGT